MFLENLFGKLQEHEMELMRLNQHDENDKKKKRIALKASSSIQEESDKEDKGNQRKENFNSKKRREDSCSVPKCYECNQPGHLRVDCPSFKKRMEKYDRKTDKDKKAKKAYIVEASFMMLNQD
ncbi:hypothetical protein HKD37_19G053318 [Glycine soja]